MLAGIVVGFGESMLFPHPSPPFGINRAHMYQSLRLAAIVAYCCLGFEFLFRYHNDRPFRFGASGRGVLDARVETMIYALALSTLLLFIRYAPSHFHKFSSPLINHHSLRPGIFPLTDRSTESSSLREAGTAASCTRRYTLTSWTAGWSSSRSLPSI